MAVGRVRPLGSADERRPSPEHVVLAAKRGRGLRRAGGRDLLDRIAVELDVGRCSWSLIENATFRRGTAGGRMGVRTQECDIDAVDWFLGQLLSGPGQCERAEVDADPWRDLPVAQYTRSGISDLAGHPAETSWRVQRESFAAECQNAWHDFGQLPGRRLWSQPTGLWSLRGGQSELRTAEQILASWRGSSSSSWTYIVVRRSFTLMDTEAAKSLFPGSAEIAARMARDRKGHFAEKTAGRQSLRWEYFSEVVDEAGTPMLCISGKISYGELTVVSRFPISDLSGSRLGVPGGQMPS
jgi:hypothetical protein